MQGKQLTLALCFYVVQLFYTGNCAEAQEGVSFVRADANNDHAVDTTDAIVTLRVLFLGEESPGCDDALDSNDDGTLNVSDPVVTLVFLFRGTVTIPAPGPDLCGPDPTEDSLSCSSFSSCFCGGIAGFPCGEGERCVLEGNFPDAGGQCVPDNE